MDVDLCWRCLNNMFFHLADKIYIVNYSSKPEKAPDIHQVNYNSYSNDIQLYPTYSIYVKKIINKYVQNRMITLLIVPDEDFKTMLLDYCGFLKLSQKAFEAIISHSLFCETYIEDVDKIISKPSNIRIDWIPYKQRSKIHNPEIFPAELCINQIDECSWALKKYEYFRMYELYSKIKDMQFNQYLNGNIKKSLIKNNDQKIKKLYKNKNFLSNISRDIDVSFLNISIKEYIASRPTLGYNRFNIWKFNWILVNVIQQEGYKI